MSDGAEQPELLNNRVRESVQGMARALASAHNAEQRARLLALAGALAEVEAGGHAAQTQTQRLLLSTTLYALLNHVSAQRRYSAKRAALEMPSTVSPMGS